LIEAKPRLFAAEWVHAVGAAKLYIDRAVGEYLGEDSPKNSTCPGGGSITDRRSMSVGTRSKK
jgi:hypothetical protein